MLRPYVRSGLAPISVQDVSHHQDPFYCECRAFGRLRETGREDLAVQCYGYIVTDPKHEEDVLSQFGIADWDRSEEDQGQPIRAIVKEIIESDFYFVPKMIPKMMKQLKEINSLGIQVWDVKADMYLGGVLLDLSQARTVPHYQLDLELGLWSKDSILKEGSEDYESFDAHVIEDWNEDHDEQIWVRFWPNRRYRRQLRCYTQRMFTRSVNLPLAALYDWKRTTKKRKAKAKSKLAAPHQKVSKAGRKKKKA